MNFVVTNRFDVVIAQFRHRVDAERFVKLIDYTGDADVRIIAL